MNLSDPRRASIADATAVRDFVRASYAKWVPVLGREPRPMRADYQSAVRDHLVWLFGDSGGLVAVLELVPKPDHLLIENVAVAVTHQKQGIGSQLMAFAELEARRLDLPELRLYTNERMLSNIALYVKLGYVETHRELFAGSDTKGVYMTKHLS